MRAVVERIQVPPPRVRLGLFVLAGVVFLGLAVPAFFEFMTYWTGIVLGEYIYPTHEFHHLVLGATLPILLLGVIAQAIYPSRRAGALYSSIVIWVAVTLAFSIGGEFSAIQLVLLGLLLVMAVLHPLGRDGLPSYEGVGTSMAIVAGVTAVVAIVVAGIELNAQFTAVDGHVGFSHYLFMAVAWMSIGGMTVLGALKPAGWRFPIYGAAALLGVIGGASIIYPGAEQGSSLGVVLGTLAILWAIVVVVTAERGDAILERVPLTRRLGKIRADR